MNLETQIKNRAEKLSEPSETIPETISRVLGEKIDEEELSQDEELKRAREALRDDDKSLNSTGIEFEGL